MAEKVAVIVLAAGSSERMGRAKQFLPWRNTTLVRHATLTALAVDSAEVFVVLGARKSEVMGELNGLSVNIVDNADYQKGLGSSLATGVREIIKPAHRRPKRILVMLADQPAVTPEYLSALIRHSEGGHGITATAYAGRAGVPAVFPEPYFDQLTRLDGDTGAGRLLNGGTFPVALIQPDFDLFDIDTPEDYRRYEGDQERY
ncbi:NTP transferase domain-containing protein [Lewinella sp. IMCC34191]|uniref:nucleotidyltransferase family protein n=1 Tax=Lewinella sp. IMCC34191 TaxID=2259172 RepID=UPI000E21CD61|nr:nucleotidyltransferase family protein [Lewinella sp. IMCC34191]